VQLPYKWEDAADLSKLAAKGIRTADNAQYPSMLPCGLTWVKLQQQLLESNISKSEHDGVQHGAHALHNVATHHLLHLSL